MDTNLRSWGTILTASHRARALEGNSMGYHHSAITEMAIAILDGVADLMRALFFF
jgi:hypothetical protein